MVGVVEVEPERVQMGMATAMTWEERSVVEMSVVVARVVVKEAPLVSEALSVM